MNIYTSMSNNKLKFEHERLLKKYVEFKSKNLKLDMSRGKPSTEQVALSLDLLDVLTSKSNCMCSNVDCRNYGQLEGLIELRKLFSPILGVDAENIIVGGNSSIKMMFDSICCLFTHGTSENNIPWGKQKNIKFLCPVPGYDRHFAILDYFSIQTINIPMLESGPDMDMIEEIVSKDETVKGIWCVPKYSNPQGITYSDLTVKRFANLAPKASDFRIFWDNAYAVHSLCEKDDNLLNLMFECQKTGKVDLPIIFCSTSKMTFAGAGIAAMGTSKNNFENFKKRYSVQTIGADKINQLRHFMYFKDLDGIVEHMKKHKQLIRPKFDVVLNKLRDELSSLNICDWTNPSGGYFVSVNVFKNCAKEVVRLCKDAGVILTPAGATFPHGFDPDDKNIRIAPTYPSVEQLTQAMDLFCTVVKLTAVNKILSEGIQ